MITCPVCGTLNTPDRVFCRKCASDLHATVVLPGQPPPPPPKAEIPIKPILVGGGLALFLILLAIAGVLVFNGLAPVATISPDLSSEPSGATPPSAGPTLTPTLAPTPTPATPPPATPVVTPTPGPTPTEAPPVIRFFAGPSSVDCNSSGFIGLIHLSWRIGNADGASLSIDNPGVYKTYTGVLGQDDVPFACDGNPHTYILVTFGGIDPPAEKDLVVTPATP